MQIWRAKNRDKVRAQQRVREHRNRSLVKAAVELGLVHQPFKRASRHISLIATAMRKFIGGNAHVEP
jgi:hypothetical protein